jgi:hypothetical protein
VGRQGVITCINAMSGRLNLGMHEGVYEASTVGWMRLLELELVLVAS